jgi:hypothetical protein
MNGRSHKLDVEFHLLLHDCIVEGIESILGEKVMRGVLLYLGLGQYTTDPRGFHSKLSDIFGNGAVMVEKLIIKELFRRVNIPFYENGNFEFERYVNRAKEAFARMPKDPR